jgi:hypothetical protein
VYFSVFYFF